MADNTQSLVQIRDLYKRFSISGDFLDQLRFQGGKLVRHQEFVHAINGVSLDVKQGEALCVVGESGCGKSTVARTVMGLLSPSAGRSSIAASASIIWMTARFYPIAKKCR